MDDFRIVANLQHVERISPRHISGPSSAAARLGLQFERRIGRELEQHVIAGNLLHVEHNPWFSFTDAFGYSACSPDFIILGPRFAAVVEVKLTWVEEALPKLESLYCPVVSYALGRPVNGIVVCRNLKPGAPEAVFTLQDALVRPGSLLHWPHNGHIPWE